MQTSSAVRGISIGLLVAAVIGVGASSPSLARGGGHAANGVSCKTDSDCESDRCQQHVCKGTGNDTKLGDGVGCKFDSECDSGRCQQHACRGKDAKLADGVACKFDSECESKRCTQHVCRGK